MIDRRLAVPYRYALFQIPDLVLLVLALTAAHHWWELPVFAAGWIVACWILKDIVLYPWLRVAYEAHDPGHSDRLTGSIAIVQQPLDPKGWVLVGGERWSAELLPDAAPVAEGARVRVVSVRGFTLAVEPLSDASTRPTQESNRPTRRANP